MQLNLNICPIVDRIITAEEPAWTERDLFKC